MIVEPHHRWRGFTLIEVLVALAIIALGLIAVFGQMSQSATAATRLRDKTLAHWVALNQITELRLSGEYPGVGTRSDDLEMANLRWHYEVKISETDYFRRADVTVALASDPQRPLAVAVGFIGEPPAGQAASPSALDWSLPGPDEIENGSGDETKNPEANPPPNPNPNPVVVPPPTGGNETSGDK